MTSPNPAQLRSLVSVADALHFGQAADVRGISQPALSAHITQLEKLFGEKLVERTTRRVLLTPLGSQVVERSRKLLQELDDLAKLGHGARKPLSGALHLGVIPTIAPYVLAPALPAVRSRRPDLQLYLREDQTARLIDQLQRGQIDVALLALPVGSPGTSSAIILEEDFRLIAPSTHRLADRKRLNESDLEGEEVLLLEDGHCFRDQALAVCSRAGAYESSAIRANSISTLVQMTANGLGVTLLPASAVRRELGTTQDVVAIEFEAPVPSRSIGLLWRTASGRDEEFEALRDLLFECIRYC